MIIYVIISAILGCILAFITIWLNEKRKTRVVQELEPQEGTMMRIRTKVYFKNDVVKQWDKKTNFSNVEKIAEEQRVEGNSLIKLYKKIRN